MPNYVKNTTFPGLLDLLSPHSCRGCEHTGEVFCECCKNNITQHRQNFCPACKEPCPSGVCSKCRLGFPIFVVSNRSSIIGTLVHDYKYHSIRALAKPLAELIDSCLPTDLPDSSVIVPLPTATHHIRSRGLDHTYLIARHLSKIRSIPVSRALTREKNTVQVGSDRGKRLSQATSAYSLNTRISINPDKTYILLDDVWTTGASVTAAADHLRAAGAKNIMATLLAYSA